MAGKQKVTINPSRNKQFYVEVIAGNNKTLSSSETFKTIQGALSNAKALKKVLKNAEIVDNTKKGKK